MQTEENIKDHGRFLTSLANFGVLLVSVLGTGLVLAHYPEGLPKWPILSRIWGLDLLRAAEMNMAGKVLLSLSNASLTLSLLLPLLALHNLGRTLSHSEVLSRPVAESFGKLARSLLLHYTVLQILAGMAVSFAEQVSDTSIYAPEWDFAGFYVWLIACTCLYSVAHLMKLASEAADDSRSIV
jgi:hypothetical protein